MSSSGPTFNIGNLSGGLAFTAGGHSTAQAGTGHSAHVEHRQGADLADLMPLLQELEAEINKLPSTQKRDDLAAHVEVAQHEAAKTDKPRDAGRIKRALDVVKSGAEGLENSGKIITLCNKAYNVLAPLLGFPPSPLP